jgi:hypothetical protein
MRCRKVICAACRTRVDGVNHCHACLKALGSRKEEAGPRFDPWPVLGLFFLGAGGLALFGLCWLFQGVLAP